MPFLEKSRKLRHSLGRPSRSDIVQFEFSRSMEKYIMNCIIRKWKLTDAKDIAVALSNKKIQDNLRDGLPYPYSEQDGIDFISSMLSANEDETFAFAITLDIMAQLSRQKFDVFIMN